MPLPPETVEDYAAFRLFFETGGLEVDETDLHGVRTQLHNAAQYNCQRIAEFLLRKNADASLVAENGHTPLHIAASMGHDTMVGLILEHSSRERVRKFIDAKTTDNGFTALHLAAMKNSYTAVGLLCFGANFEAKDRHAGTMPIQLTSGRARQLLRFAGEMSRAAIEGKKCDDLIQRLVDLRGFEFLAATLARNAQGHTPLQAAIHHGHMPTVKTIAEARMQHITADNALPSTAESLTDKVMVFWDNIRKLHLRKLRDNEELSEKEALREGSYALYCAWKIFEIFDEYSRTLKEPLEEPHVKIIEEVLEVLEFDVQHFQANYDDDDDPENFVTRAQSARYYQMLCNKLDRQWFVELVEFAICVPMALLIKYINSSNLLTAVNRHDLEAAEKCTKESVLVDMDVRDIGGNRPLHIAIGLGDVEMVEFLLTNKADMLATTNDNKTALHVAVEMGHFDIVELLLCNCNTVEVNDYVNAKIKSTGATALHLAVKTGRLDIAWTLLEFHAIYCPRDSRGKLPRDLTTDNEMKKFFIFIDGVFADAKNGRKEVIEKFQCLERALLLAVGNACDKEGYSVPQVASVNKHRDIGSQIFKMVVEAKKAKDVEFTEGNYSLM